MNTKVSTYLVLVSGFLLIVGCGGGQSDWKDILRDGKVFSGDHLDKLKEVAHEITSGKTKGVEFHIHAAGGETVGVDATEVERLYGSPTSVVADEWHLTHYYGEVGIDLDLKTKGVIGVVVPTKEVAVEFEQVLDTILPPNRFKATKPAGVVNGTITVNGIVMDVQEAFAVWGVDGKNRLSIYLFPSFLTGKERERLGSKEPLNGPFFVASKKETSDPAKWLWYPFAEVQIEFATDKPRTTENISRAYLHLQVFGEDRHKKGDASIPCDVSSLAVTGDGQLEITFQGNKRLGSNSCGWNSCSWNVETKNQPIVE